MSSSSSAPGPQLGATLIMLLRGLVDRAMDPERWHDLTLLQAQVRDYLATLNLELVIDDAEGYAYVRQKPVDQDGDEPQVPRLIPRRQLSYQVSLILALLRRRMVEHESTSGDRLIITRSEIAEMIRVFLPETADENRFLRRIDNHLAQIAEHGFIRPLRNRDGEYEVRRILRAFVDGQWLQELATRLEAYRQHASGEEDSA